MAAAAIRTLAKVNSSAITPRQPSVPNLMDEVVMLRSILRKANDYSDVRNGTDDYTRSVLPLDTNCFTTLPTSCEWLRDVMSKASPVSTTTRSLTPTRATNLSGQ